MVKALFVNHGDTERTAMKKLFRLACNNSVAISVGH